MDEHELKAPINSIGEWIERIRMPNSDNKNYYQQDMPPSEYAAKAARMAIESLPRHQA